MQHAFQQQEKEDIQHAEEEIKEVIQQSKMSMSMQKQFD